MARHMRKLVDVRVVPAPAVPVAAAETCGLDANDGAVRMRRRIAHRFNRNRPAKLVINDCLHSCSGNLWLRFSFHPASKRPATGEIYSTCNEDVTDVLSGARAQPKNSYNGRNDVD